MLFEVHQIAIEAQGFEFAMSGEQERAARGLITSPRLDAHEAILDQIHAPHGVTGSYVVQLLKQRDRSHALPIYGNGHTMRESDLHQFCLVRRRLRSICPLPCRLKWCIGWIFEFAAFMTDVQQVAIAAMDLLATGGYRDSAAFGIRETVFTRLQVPFTPRSDDL